MIGYVFYTQLLTDKIMRTLRYLKQTALDYDMPLNTVKRISEEQPSIEFYDALEQELINRRNR